MSEITKVSDTLEELRAELQERRDSEIQMAGEVLAQYVTDHNDRAAYREIDRKVARLARAWDRMLDRLDKWHTDALVIEGSCDNFYGD